MRHPYTRAARRRVTLILAERRYRQALAAGWETVVVGQFRSRKPFSCSCWMCDNGGRDRKRRRMLRQAPEIEERNRSNGRKSFKSIRVHGWRERYELRRINRKLLWRTIPKEAK